MDSGTINRDEFKEHLQIIWYPLLLSFINEYGKDILSFHVIQVINNMKTNTVVEENNSNFLPKVLNCIHEQNSLPPVDLYTANFSGLLHQG